MVAEKSPVVAENPACSASNLTVQSAMSRCSARWSRRQQLEGSRGELPRESPRRCSDGAGKPSDEEPGRPSSLASESMMMSPSCAHSSSRISKTYARDSS